MTMGDQEEKRATDDTQEQYKGIADDAKGECSCPRPLIDAKNMTFRLLLLIM